MYTYLPALGIFPIQVQSIETELLDEVQCVDDEFLSSRWVINQARVLVASRIIPSA